MADYGDLMKDVASSSSSSVASHHSAASASSAGSTASEPKKTTVSTTVTTTVQVPAPSPSSSVHSAHKSPVSSVSSSPPPSPRMHRSSSSSSLSEIDYVHENPAGVAVCKQVARFSDKGPKTYGVSPTGEYVAIQKPRKSIASIVSSAAYDIYDLEAHDEFHAGDGIASSLLKSGLSKLVSKSGLTDASADTAGTQVTSVADSALAKIRGGPKAGANWLQNYLGSKVNSLLADQAQVGRAALSRLGGYASARAGNVMARVELDPNVQAVIAKVKDVAPDVYEEFKAEYFPQLLKAGVDVYGETAGAVASGVSETVSGVTTGAVEALVPTDHFYNAINVAMRDADDEHLYILRDLRRQADLLFSVFTPEEVAAMLAYRAGMLEASNAFGMLVPGDNSPFAELLRQALAKRREAIEHGGDAPDATDSSAWQIPAADDEYTPTSAIPPAPPAPVLYAPQPAAGAKPMSQWRSPADVGSESRSVAEFVDAAADMEIPELPAPLPPAPDAMPSAYDAAEAATNAVNDMMINIFGDTPQGRANAAMFSTAFAQQMSANLLGNMAGGVTKAMQKRIGVENAHAAAANVAPLLNFAVTSGVGRPIQQQIQQAQAAGREQVTRMAPVYQDAASTFGERIKGRAGDVGVQLLGDVGDAGGAAIKEALPELAKGTTQTANALISTIGVALAEAAAKRGAKAIGNIGKNKKKKKKKSKKGADIGSGAVFFGKLVDSNGLMDVAEGRKEYHVHGPFIFDDRNKSELYRIHKALEEMSPAEREWFGEMYTAVEMSEELGAGLRLPSFFKLSSLPGIVAGGRKASIEQYIATIANMEFSEALGDAVEDGLIAADRVQKVVLTPAATADTRRNTVVRLAEIVTYALHVLRDDYRSAMAASALTKPLRERVKDVDTSGFPDPFARSWSGQASLLGNIEGSLGIGVDTALGVLEARRQQLRRLQERGASTRAKFAGDWAESFMAGLLLNPNASTDEEVYNKEFAGIFAVPGLPTESVHRRADMLAAFLTSFLTSLVAATPGETLEAVQRAIIENSTIAASDPFPDALIALLGGNPSAVPHVLRDEPAVVYVCRPSKRHPGGSIYVQHDPTHEKKFFVHTLDEIPVTVERAGDGVILVEHAGHDTRYKVSGTAHGGPNDGTMLILTDPFD